jgi:fructan beta-fructosidase
MNRETTDKKDLTTYYDILDYEPHEYGRIGQQFKNFTNPILIPEEEKEFYDNNPGKTFEDYLDSPNFNSNYRDPKICLFKDDTNTTSFYVLLMSADYEYRIYQNRDPKTNEKLDDLITWALVGKFGVGYGVETKYIQYECPDIVRIFPSGSSHAKWVFIANINPGCPFGGSATEYFTGDFDGATYTSDHVFPKWMDFGKDHYATVTYNNIPNEERVLGLPWSSNWIYAGTVPTTQYRSTNGLPREFTLFKVKGEFFLNVAPAREAQNLRSSTRVPISETVSKKGKKKKIVDISPVAGDGMYELYIDVTVTKNAKKYGFYIYNDQGEKIDFFFDTKKDKLWNEYGLPGSGSFIMDRRYSGNHDFKSYGGWGAHGREKMENGKYAFIKNCYKYVDQFRLGTKIPMDLLKDKNKHNVQVFYDKSHVEVFVDGGRGVMTNIVFPTGDYYNKIKFYTDRGSVTFSGEAIKLEVPTS